MSDLECFIMANQSGYSKQVQIGRISKWALLLKDSAKINQPFLAPLSVDNFPLQEIFFAISRKYVLRF